MYMDYTRGRITMTSLSDFDSLAEAQAYSEEIWSKFGSGKLRGRLGKYGLYSIVKAGGSSIDTGNDAINAQIQEICTMLYDNITCGDPLDVSPDSVDGQLNRASFEFLIDNYSEKSEDITALRNEIYEEGCTVNFPFANSTQVQFNQGKGIATPVEIDWPSNNKVKVSIANNEHRCPATFYGKSDDFDDWQNLGKTIYLTTSGIAQLSNPLGYTQLKVTVPLKDAEITVGAV